MKVGTIIITTTVEIIIGVSLTIQRRKMIDHTVVTKHLGQIRYNKTSIYLCTIITPRLIKGLLMSVIKNELLMADTIYIIQIIRHNTPNMRTEIIPIITELLWTTEINNKAMEAEEIVNLDCAISVRNRDIGGKNVEID